MSDDTQMSTDVKTTEGGKIVFASDVIATIAGLAAAEVKGVAGMSGGMVEGLTQILGRKNLTKGVKVEIGTEEAAVDVSVVIQYGYRIQDVCAEVQLAIKNAIETMTGLKVVEVNVFVQAINFDSPDQAKAQKIEKIPEKEQEPPRVK